MKKIQICLAFLFCAIILSSCVDTEEYIVVNADHSGNYTLKMDMSKMLELANQFGKEQSVNKKSVPAMDTLISFKELVAASDKLTAQEKELYKDAYFKVKSDSATNEFKMEVGCSFKNISQLPEIRKNLFKISEKLGVNKMLGDKDKPSFPGAGSSAAEEDISNALNPSSKDYNFTASPGKISYKSNKTADSSHVANDSIMQMMQQLTMFTGEMTIKTVITLPNAPKKIGNSKAVSSADKKTITFSYTLTDLMEKPETGEFEIEY